MRRDLDEKKTLVGFKLTSSRRTVIEVVQMAKILIGLGLIFAAIFGAKLALCRSEHPEWSVKKCVLPLRGEK